jgi:hypothetical protein
LEGTYISSLRKERYSKREWKQNQGIHIQFKKERDRIGTEAEPRKTATA